MKLIFIIVVLFLPISVEAQKMHFSAFVKANINTYSDQNGIKKATAVPTISKNKKLKPYQFRLEYILMNLTSFYNPDKKEIRDRVFKLYPNTSAFEKAFVEELSKDSVLTFTFNTAVEAILHPNNDKITFNTDQMMLVASRFFYAHNVQEDTTFMSHICVAINGTKEIKDYQQNALLASFCIEAVFEKMANIDVEFRTNLKQAKTEAKSKFINLDQYLEDAKQALYNKMQNSEVLKKELLEYYEQNKSNLAFVISN